jgi:predicted RNA polymerase sigma factor
VTSTPTQRAINAVFRIESPRLIAGLARIVRDVGHAEELAQVDTLTSEPSLESYHLLPSVRGDLLAKVGRFDEARIEFERAASLTRNARERELLLERAAACAKQIGAAR